MTMIMTMTHTEMIKIMIMAPCEPGSTLVTLV